MNHNNRDIFKFNLNQTLTVKFPDLEPAPKTICFYEVGIGHNNGESLQMSLTHG